MKKQFLIKSHDQNKAQRPENYISDILYIWGIMNFTIETYYGIITKAFNDLWLMQFPYTILRKNKKLLSLKVWLKKKSTSVNWLRLTYPGNSLMKQETHLRNTGCLPFCCVPSLAYSVVSAAVSLCSSCSLVGDSCIITPGPCGGWSYGRSTWPQCLRLFINRLLRVSLVEILPPNVTEPWSMTGSTAVPAVA